MNRAWIIIGIALLLLSAETVRRYGATWTCYVELRYSVYRVGDSKDEAWTNAEPASAIFPFGSERKPWFRFRFQNPCRSLEFLESVEVESLLFAGIAS